MSHDGLQKEEGASTSQKDTGAIGEEEDGATTKIAAEVEMSAVLSHETYKDNNIRVSIVGPRLTISNSECTSSECGVYMPKAAHIAIVLPDTSWLNLLEKYDSHKCYYHTILTTNDNFNLFHSLSLDADAYVESALQYIRSFNENPVIPDGKISPEDIDTNASGCCKDLPCQPITGVMAFDSFTTMVASTINEAMTFPGPSFHSTFCCSNKYYMRKHIEGSVIEGTPKESDYPVVIKCSDSQFYVAVQICMNEDEWKQGLEAMSEYSPSEDFYVRRQHFYKKWAEKFGVEDMMKEGMIPLIHTEPYIKNEAEYQMEIVVNSDGDQLIADTGDIVHENSDVITIFKTPGSFALTYNMKKWIYRTVQKYVDRGWKNGAMDFEFFKTGDESFELVEINSRYSYMGYLQKMPLNVTDLHPEAERQELRNLRNRALLALGENPQTLPCRDEEGIAKVAAFIYTDRLGKPTDFFDVTKMESYVKERKITAWIPKPLLSTPGYVITDRDLLRYHGLAKLGCILTTMADDKDTINKLLHEIISSCFKEFSDSDATSGGYFRAKLHAEGVHPEYLALVQKYRLHQASFYLNPDFPPAWKETELDEPAQRFSESVPETDSINQLAYE